MSKILKLTAKLLDDAIARLEKSISEQTSELSALKASRGALESPRTHATVKGKYRTTPTPALRGKTQKKVYVLISNRGPMRAADLSKLIGISQKAVSMCLYGMKNQGILKVTERGRYGLK